LPARALLQAIVEMSDEAIFTCDIAGRVTAWSATSERLFGSPAGTVLGTSFSALFARHLRPELETAVTIVVAGDLIKHFETEVVRPDGMPTPCHCVGYIVGAKSGAKELDRLSRSVQALFETDEFADLVGAARAHVGSGLRHIAALVDGQQPAPDGAVDIVGKVRNLVEHKVNRPRAP
jgi:PAS domain S-box-containing protein